MGPVRRGGHRKRGPDFAAVPAESITPQHYAFRLPDEQFDAAFARIRQAGIRYCADPQLKQPGEINHHHGGLGLYFRDPGRTRHGDHHPVARGDRVGGGSTAAAYFGHEH